MDLNSVGSSTIDEEENVLSVRSPMFPGFRLLFSCILRLTAVLCLLLMLLLTLDRSGAGASGLYPNRCRTAYSYSSSSFNIYDKLFLHQICDAVVFIQSFYQPQTVSLCKVENTHTVWVTSCLTGLDLTKQVNMLLIQHKQSS